MTRKEDVQKDLTPQVYTKENILVHTCDLFNHAQFPETANVSFISMRSKRFGEGIVHLVSTSTIRWHHQYLISVLFLCSKRRDWYYAICDCQNMNLSEQRSRSSTLHRLPNDVFCSRMLRVEWRGKTLWRDPWQWKQENSMGTCIKRINSSNTRRRSSTFCRQYHGIYHSRKFLTFWGNLKTGPILRGFQRSATRSEKTNWHLPAKFRVLRTLRTWRILITFC